jgi:hypothetical protein
MGKQYLIPVKDTDDANKAIARIPQIAEQGDEVVVLIVSDVPEGELTGSAPAPTVIDPMLTTGGTTSEPRAADDIPTFLGRDEIMEMKHRELCEALDPQIAGLHDRGYSARVDAVFSDEPGATIRDYASDLNVTDVYLTPEFRSDLDEETQELVKAL